jgi:hypothetical protein
MRQRSGSEVGVLPPVSAKVGAVSERTAGVVEVASILVIGIVVLVAGWTLLENLARFRLASGAMLVVLAGAQVAALRRDFKAPGDGTRLRVTRDLAFVGATLIALAYVLVPQRWAVGASISMLEFAIVLELLTRLAPAPPNAT